MAEGNGRAWTPDIKEIGDRIAALTLSKAVELGDYMEEVHGFKAAAVAAAAPAGGGAVAAPAAPAEKTEFTVMILGVPDQTKKLNVIKAVREMVQGLGLKEAKELVDSAPKPVKENIPKDEAEAIKKKLEEAGAKVELK